MNFLSDGRFICLNNHKDATGGPFTRYDPADPTNKKKMSCIDLVIISMNLLPFFKAIEIDSSMKYSSSRAVRKSVSKYPDHFPVIVVFENIPRVNLQKPISTPTLIPYGKQIERVVGKTTKELQTAMMLSKMLLI